ncbi:MAG TPA: hypothetical protein P5137_04350 [Candidatus Brocadiia bacterium]|nr:hypothetical protein [Candidatus Brocadiia bacterium]
MRTAFVAVIASVLTAGLVSFAQQGPRTSAKQPWKDIGADGGKFSRVETKELVLTDDKGRPRIIMSSWQLDSADKVNLAKTKTCPHIMVFDSTGKRQITLGEDERSGWFGVTLADLKSKKSVRISLDNGEAVVTDAAGKTLWAPGK